MLTLLQYIVGTKDLMKNENVNSAWRWKIEHMWKLTKKKHTNKLTKKEHIEKRTN
jgi:hypothetical protein